MSVTEVLPSPSIVDIYIVHKMFIIACCTYTPGLKDSRSTPATGISPVSNESAVTPALDKKGRKLITNCCGDGFYGVGPSCIPCAPGTFHSGTTCIDIFSSFQCDKCPVGSATILNGQSSCQTCTPGTFAATTGALLCSPCANGQTSLAGASSCYAPPTPSPTATPTQAPTALSCGTGYALSASGTTCDATSKKLCSSGKFITKITLTQSSQTKVDGVLKITCSNPATVAVIAGQVTDPNLILTDAIAGDGSSSSPGFCTIYEIYGTAGASQLLLTECGGGGSQGPYGTIATSPIKVNKSCGSGEKAVGVEWLPGAFLSYFNIVCGPICAPGTFASFPSGNCVPCQPGYASPNSGAPRCDMCAANTWAAAGASSCTSCPDGFSSPPGSTTADACYKSGVTSCPDTYVISSISLRSGDAIDYVQSITCTDGNEYNINVGNSGGGDAHDVAGPFSSYTSGNFGGGDGTAGLFFTSNSGNSDTYGANVDSSTISTKHCLGSQLLSGLEVTTNEFDSYAQLGSTAICYGSLECDAGKIQGSDGVCTTCPQDTFAAAGDFSCTSCPEGFNSVAGATSIDYCYKSGVTSCPSGSVISSISLRSGGSLDYVKSITCTDGRMYDIRVGNAGGGAAHDIAGPFIDYVSASSTAGFFFTSSSQKTTGPFGSIYDYTTLSPKACPDGEFLSGLDVAPVNSDTGASLGSTPICSGMLAVPQTLNINNIQETDCMIAEGFWDFNHVATISGRRLQSVSQFSSDDEMTTQDFFSYDTWKSKCSASDDWCEQKWVDGKDCDPAFTSWRIGFGHIVRRHVSGRTNGISGENFSDSNRTSFYVLV